MGGTCSLHGVTRKEYNILARKYERKRTQEYPVMYERKILKCRPFLKKRGIKFGDPVVVCCESGHEY
jgi:hypothetical protein